MAEYDSKSTFFFLQGVLLITDKRRLSELAGNLAVSQSLKFKPGTELINRTPCVKIRYCL